MKSITLVFLLVLSLLANSQSVQRIPLSNVADATFSQWNYSSYLNDNVENLVPFVWENGFVYSTVIITLQTKCVLNKVILHDHDSVFTINPAFIYAINGTDTTYLGKFTGDQYKAFTTLNIPYPLVATKLAIKKFGNNIPPKVQVFGTPITTQTVADIAPLRISINTINTTINTGVKFTPWLNDNLSSLVASAWGSINNQYVDVILKLTSRCQISKISLYDESGVFTTNPAYIFLQKDTTLKLIGKFEGLLYKEFLHYQINEDQQADAIIIRKFGNNIPQKVQIYGRIIPVDPNKSVQLITPIIPVIPSVTTLPVAYNKIPIEASRWFILNHAPNGIGLLFNGITTENVNTGFANFNPTYECIYPINDGELISISSIKMFDYNGIFITDPAKIFVISKDGKRINLATFKGLSYNEWVGPYPERNLTGADKFNLDSTVTNIQYIGISCTQNNLPTEIEFFGTYTASTVKKIPLKKYATFNKTLGFNGFEWDFVKPATNSRVIAEDKYAAIKNFTGFRHYLDWKQLEGSQGKYTFNPTSAGGWNYDIIYERCKRDNIEVLACIKNTPEWMENAYPISIRSTDNAPLQYGFPKDSTQSYIEKGMVAFQFTARYGQNKNIPLSLIKVNTQPRWTNDPANEIKVGLGFVKYIECGNELDKWWKGTYGYMNAYQYAALLSAFYDGHNGTLGNNVGVKTADSTMQVVISGLALSDPSYVRGMIEWCRKNRGYKLNGEINLCWNVINYHHYSNDGSQSQNGNSTRGAAPEVSDAVAVAKSFINLSDQFAYGMPVWITELGFDINQQSPLKAIAIGDKSILQTQADWILRSSLVYLREGISNVFFYELKDYNLTSATKFASMGLTDSLYKRRPAMDYLFQVNQLLGNYRYNRNLQKFPIVDEYENEGNLVYAVWVPDEKGTTIACSIPFPYTDSVMIYRPQIGSDNLKTETVAVTNGVVKLTATETPLFVSATPLTSNQSYVIAKNLIDKKKPHFTKIKVIK